MRLGESDAVWSFHSRCLCDLVLNMLTWLLPFCQQFPVGLSVMIEKKSRRMELALYCLARAIESFAICVAEGGVFERYNLTPPKRIDVFLFSAATAIIMHCYAQERDVFRSKYLNVLDWVFGLPDGATKYVPAPSHTEVLLPKSKSCVELSESKARGWTASGGVWFINHINSFRIRTWLCGGRILCYIFRVVVHFKDFGTW